MAQTHLQRLKETDKWLLLHTARESVHEGLRTDRPFAPELHEYPEHLLLACSSFVTLIQDNNLRGCIGCFRTERPLVQDIAANAFTAAFRDSRFAPLTHRDLNDIEIEVSLLTPPARISVASEQEALERLSVGKDGLILEVGHYSAVFLPTAWRQLPDPRQFLQQLKVRAGLPADYWSAHIKLSRYRALSFSEEELLGQA